MIVPRVFKSRQRKRKNISIVLSSQNPSEIIDFRGIFLFFVYCGAGFERTHHTNISLPTNHQHRYILVCLLL